MQNVVGNLWQFIECGGGEWLLHAEGLELLVFFKFLVPFLD